MRNLPARIAAAAAAFAVFSGCDSDVAGKERSERSSALFRNAEADYRAGNIDDAVKGFERVVREEPKAVSAHFQLAVLLQDARRDYIGAIAHYREYLALRPESDKSTIASERMAMCRKLLANELAPSAGVQADESNLAAERKRCERLAAENAALLRKTQELESRISSLSAELKGVLSHETESAPSAFPQSPSEADLFSESLEGESPLSAGSAVRAAAAAEDSGSLAASLEEAKSLLKETDAVENASAPPPPSGAPAARGGPLALPSAPAAADRPARPKTYTVQPGDGLMKISEKVYGVDNRWMEIRDANKAKIYDGDKVREGTVLEIP